MVWEEKLRAAIHHLNLSLAMHICLQMVNRKRGKQTSMDEITAATAERVKTNIGCRSMERLFNKHCLRNKNYSKTSFMIFILAAAARAADVDFSHKKQLQAMAWFANMHGTFYCPIKFSVLLSRECWFSPLVLLVVNRFIFGLSLSWICFRQKSPRKMANYNFFIKQPFLNKKTLMIIFILPEKMVLELFFFFWCG